jgi:hypothetical protein
MCHNLIFVVFVNVSSEHHYYTSNLFFVKQIYFVSDTTIIRELQAAHVILGIIPSGKAGIQFGENTI